MKIDIFRLTFYVRLGIKYDSSRIVLLMMHWWYIFQQVFGRHIARFVKVAHEQHPYTVYPKKYAHGFVVLYFVVVMQSFIMNSHEVFIHFHQGYFAGTGAIVRLPQCQWSKPDGYNEISQCITTTKHSKAKTVCIFLGIYCKVEVLDKQHKSRPCSYHSGYSLKLTISRYLQSYRFR